MREQTASRILRLYPASWRERYADEYRALLAEYPLGATILLDTWRGALDAHLHPSMYLHRSWNLNTRLRPSLVTVFVAWIAFVVVGLWLNGQIDDSPYAHIMRHGGSLQVAYLVLEAGSALSLLAATVGGLPVVWQIWTRSPELRWLLMVPAVAFAAIAAPFGLLAIIAANHLVPANAILTSDGGHWVRDFLVAIFVLGAVASVLAVTRAVIRGQASDGSIALARLAGWGVTASMALMTVTTIAWGLLAGSQDGQDFYSVDFTAFGSPTVAKWVVIVIIMALATVAALISLLRGGREGAQPATAALA